MITIRKLKSLKPGTKLRKSLLILKSTELELLKKESINMIYLKDFFKLIISDDEFSKILKEDSKKAIQFINDQDLPKLIRIINKMYYSITKILGKEIGDWDFSYIKKYNNNEINNSSIKPKVFLEDIRSPFNVGSIFRTAECFGVEKIIVSPDCASPEHKRAERSAMSCTKRIPWEVQNLEYLKESNKEIFALELGGSDIFSFQFPEDGIVILGNEELGVSPEALSLAEKSLGRVSIPLYGNKASLNVSNAFAILMNAWSHYNIKNKTNIN